VCCEATGDHETVTADLDAALAARLGLHLDVRVLAGGAVPRQEVGKAVRVVSWDDGAPPLPGL
jgi:phenylacetate-CoA ligase